MIVVLDPDPQFATAVQAALHRADVYPALDAHDLDRILETDRGRVSAVIAGPGNTTSGSLAAAATVGRRAPEVGVIMIESAVGSDVLQAALRAGVRDVLPTTFEAEVLTEAIGRAEQVAHAFRDSESGGPSQPSRPGKIITVFSPKGGVGKSVVATNLAVALASGRPVAAVDLDLQFGDLAIMFQVFPSRTIHDAALRVDEADPETLLEFLTPHRSGVALLPAPLEPGLAENVTADAAQAVLCGLRDAGRTVVVDTPPWFTDHVLQALDVSDEMVLVATLDVPSVKNLKVALQTLTMLGYPRERLRLVLNRADSKVGLSASDVERALGTTVDVAIPSSRAVPLSVNRGLPIAATDARAPVSQAIASLAALVSGGVPAQAPVHKKIRIGRRGR